MIIITINKILDFCQAFNVMKTTKITKFMPQCVIGGKFSQGGQLFNQLSEIYYKKISNSASVIRLKTWLIVL
jgi:hypothetical protein